MEMEKANENEELKAAVDFEKSIRRKNEMERNIALGLDFTTTLASALARSRGARHSLDTNFTGAVNKKIAYNEQKMIDAMRDYNGRRAALAFKSLLDKKENGTQQNGQEAGMKGEYRPLFNKPLSLMDGKVNRRPQMVDIKPLKPVNPMALEFIMRNTNKKKSKL